MKKLESLAKYKIEQSSSIIGGYRNTTFTCCVESSYDSKGAVCDVDNYTYDDAGNQTAHSHDSICKN